MEDEFDLDEYSQTIKDETLVEAEQNTAEGKNPMSAIDQAVRSVSREKQDELSIDQITTLLDESSFDPFEWEHTVEGDTEWRTVVRKMALTVLRQEVRSTLEDDGYLDDHWSPTEKLRNLFEEV